MGEHCASWARKVLMQGGGGGQSKRSVTHRRIGQRSEIVRITEARLLSVGAGSCKYRKGEN